MRLVAVVAADVNGVIGRGGRLPWHLPGDLRRFKRLTLGKPCLMGRRTYESILAQLGKPLPGRLNVVVSRTGAPAPREGVRVARSLDAALALPEVADAPEVAVIGGAGLFEAALPRCDALWLTRVEHAFDGDTWLRFDPAEWREVHREAFAAGVDGAWPTTFIQYERALA